MKCPIPTELVHSSGVICLCLLFSIRPSLWRCCSVGSAGPSSRRSENTDLVVNAYGQMWLKLSMCLLQAENMLSLIFDCILLHACQSNNFGPTERRKEDLRGFGQDVPRRFDVGALLNMTTGWSICHLSALVRYSISDVCRRQCVETWFPQALSVHHATVFLR